MFRDVKLPVMESLDIPDEYTFMDAELVELIRDGTEFHLKNRLGDEQSSARAAAEGGADDDELFRDGSGRKEHE